MNRIIINFTAALLLFLTGCSGSARFSTGLLDRLKNRGPVPLSSENPFLVANLMLSREMDHSSELRGFIERRGAPAAIEVDKGTFSSITMTMYYPENQEYYIAEDVSGTWAIRGPTLIEEEELQTVQRIIRGDHSKVLAGKKPPGTELLPKQRAVMPVPHADDKDIPNLDEIPSSPESVVVKRKEPKQDDRFAELTPKGDLVHYVTFDAETYSAIAKWYTGEELNADKIARTNNKKIKDGLDVGDVIVIPKYLVKNKVRMTESALDALHVIQREQQGKY